MRIDLDREKAMTLGVPVNEVFDTLQSTFGALYVNDFNRSGRVYQVQLQSEPRFRAYPEDIRNVYVRAKSGDLVPLTALASIREVKGPELLERFNVFTSAKILGSAAPGYSSGDAIKAMEEVASEVLPEGYAPAWTGTAYQEKMSGGASSGVYLLGVLMVFLILAAQFERLDVSARGDYRGAVSPFGALTAVFLRASRTTSTSRSHADSSASQPERDPDRRVRYDEASRRHAAGAGRSKARSCASAIVMTSLTLIFGVLPLAISSGAGAASRHSLGTSVIGGMLAATFIATFFVPLFFRWIAGLRRKKGEQHGSEVSEANA